MNNIDDDSDLPEVSLKLLSDLLRVRRGRGQAGQQTDLETIGMPGLPEEPFRLPKVEIGQACSVQVCIPSERARWKAQAVRHARTGKKQVNVLLPVQR